MRNEDVYGSLYFGFDLSTHFSLPSYVSDPPVLSVIILSERLTFDKKTEI